MADTPPDPKKEMESWFVEGLEPTPMKKKPAPAPPLIAPKPDGKPPGKGRLLPALIVLALLGSGGYYFYKTYVRKPKVEEAVLPKPVEEAPAPPVPAVPEPNVEQKKTVVRPAKKSAKTTEPPEQPEPAETPAPVVEVPPKPKADQPATPSSGILLWSGKVEKDGMIVIDGAKSDSGTVNGALPGVPITVRVEPKGFTVSDPPSAANGWKRIAIHSQKKAHIVVTVFWNTKPQ